MKLSQGVEWAAHCATVLAALPEGAALSAAVLAEYHGVPQPYLAKSLQALSRAGIVTSAQGRGGGYRLARPAEQVTLLDVVTAVEGPEQAFRCAEIRRNAPHASPEACYSSPCAIAASMWTAEQAWRDSLATVTMASLASHVRDVVPADVGERNRAWIAARSGRHP